MPADSPAGQAVGEWRDALVADLGGDLSQQRLTLVELACRQRYLLDLVDGWLFVQRSVVNKRKRVLLPLVKERQTIADSLARLLLQLGLDRVPREADDLRTYLDAMTET